MTEEAQNVRQRGGICFFLLRLCIKYDLLISIDNLEGSAFWVKKVTDFEVCFIVASGDLKSHSISQSSVIWGPNKHPSQWVKSHSTPVSSLRILGCKREGWGCCQLMGTQDLQRTQWTDTDYISLVELAFIFKGISPNSLYYLYFSIFKFWERGQKLPASTPSLWNPTGLQSPHYLLPI